MRNLATKTFIHWMAVLAILMGSLAPSISQAASSSNSSFKMEICSADGSKISQVIDVDTEKSLPVGHEHCPYCLVHAISTPAVDTDLEFAKPQSTNLYPQLFYQSPKPLFAWVSLPSRAPPQLV